MKLIFANHEYRIFDLIFEAVLEISDIDSDIKNTLSDKMNQHVRNQDMKF